MNLIPQFRRLLFAQVLLGIAAFCIAEQNAGMLLAATAVAALSWYVTEGPSGRPLPRSMTNLAAVAVLMVLVWRLLVWRSEDLVIVMGHFTMWLQIVLLYRDKGPREEGQLLVLSVVQMIAASVVSISMTYGVLLAIYCVLTLATVLLFQLKATSDFVHQSNQAAAPSHRDALPPEIVVGRGHHWQLRTTAVMIGLTCAMVAVVVFIIMPRRDVSLQHTHGGGRGLSQQQVGFSESVSLEGGPSDRGGQQSVLHVRLSEGGEYLGSSDEPVYLRGAALDHYEPRTRTWIRSHRAAHRDRSTRPRVDGTDADQVGVQLAAFSDPTPQFEAEVTLRNGYNPVIFTLYPGPTWFESDHVHRLVFNALDHRLAAAASRGGTLVYHLRTPRAPQARTAVHLQREYQRSLYGPDSVFRRHSDAIPDAEELADYARGWEGETQRLREYARRVLEPRGLTRDPRRRHTSQDYAVAAALAEHLATAFRYTLENPRPPRGADPVSHFLHEQRQGHCEIFAAAHAALCRAMGIPARVVTGYLATDYNRLGQYYTVRRRNAHAWTEIYAGPTHGWRRFDPTPAEPVRQQHEPPSGWVWELRQLHNYLEFTWLGSIVTYDPQTRRQVLDDIQITVAQAARNDEHWLGKMIGWLRRVPELWRLERINYTLAAFIICALGLAMASLVRTLILRHRRMAALQLTALPRSERRDLAHRLGFYIQMLDMLERRGYVRPRWQSPQAFAHELAEANPMRFDPVVALTEVFYEVRFGHRPLDNDRKRRVRAHLRQLEYALAEVRA